MCLAERMWTIWWQSHLHLISMSSQCHCVWVQPSYLHTDNSVLLQINSCQTLVDQPINLKTNGWMLVDACEVETEREMRRERWNEWKFWIDSDIKRWKIDCTIACDRREETQTNRERERKMFLNVSFCRKRTPASFQRRRRRSKWDCLNPRTGENWQRWDWQRWDWQRWVWQRWVWQRWDWQRWDWQRWVWQRWDWQICERDRGVMWMMSLTSVFQRARLLILEANDPESELDLDITIISYKGIYIVDSSHLNVISIISQSQLSQSQCYINVISIPSMYLCLTPLTQGMPRSPM